MALEFTPVAGRYSGTYNSVTVGIQRRGFTLQQTSHAQVINQSDAYGDSILDFVVRGGDVAIMTEALSFIAGVVTPFWPYASLGVMRVATTSEIGRMTSGVASALVLSAVAGSAYATAGAVAIASLTGASCIIAPNTPLELLFNSELRTVPLKWQLLPTESAGTTRWFSYT